jgi:protein-tyrosine sulfotransferase
MKPLQNAVHTLSAGRLKLGWYDCGFVSAEAPIFAGGSPRSGTTLLYSILNAHSRISLGLETGLLTGNRDLQKISRRSTLPVDRLRRIYRNSRCYPDFTQQVLTTLMHDQGKLRWGDKSPVNVNVVDGIFRYFPHARFIHAVRDGRDAVCSIRPHPPSFGNVHPSHNPWEKCVDLWCDWVGRGLRWRGDPRYFEVRYENLVANPRDTIGKLLEWLGEPWEEDLLVKSIRTSVSSHPGVSKPVSDASVGRWREDLPAEARALFKGKANELLVRLGYVEDESWMAG